MTVTREKDDPGCYKAGWVPLREITAEEMSPLEPMSRATLEDIQDAARARGADYVVVRPGALGPEGELFRCG